MSKKPRGLLDDDGEEKGGRSVGERIRAWWNPPRGEWSDRAANLGLQIGGGLLGIPVPFNVNRWEGGERRPGVGLQLPNPVGQAGDAFAAIRDLFRANNPGEPLPAWLQPGAPMAEAAPPTYGQLPAWDGGNPNAGPQQNPYYGDGRGMFPMHTPSTYRPGGQAGTGRHVQHFGSQVIEGDAARALFQSMRDAQMGVRQFHNAAN